MLPWASGYRAPRAELEAQICFSGSGEVFLPPLSLNLSLAWRAPDQRERMRKEKEAGVRSKADFRPEPASPDSGVDRILQRDFARRLVCPKFPLPRSTPVIKN